MTAWEEILEHIIAMKESGRGASHITFRHSDFHALMEEFGRDEACTCTTEGEWGNGWLGDVEVRIVGDSGPGLFTSLAR